MNTLKKHPQKYQGSIHNCLFYDSKHDKGFTLIEILIVIGIIAILATTVIVAINPARQFAQARDTQRTSNINTILNAIGQNLADNRGIFTCSGAAITTTETHIGTNSGLINLACLIPVYIATAIPSDPSSGTDQDTQYTVKVDSYGRYTVCAPNTEPSIPRTTSLCATR